MLLTGKVKIHMIVQAFTDRWEDMRPVVRLVCRLDLGRQTGNGSWNPIHEIVRRVLNDHSGALGVRDFDDFVQTLVGDAELVIW